MTVCGALPSSRSSEGVKTAIISKSSVAYCGGESSITNETVMEKRTNEIRLSWNGPIRKRGVPK